MICKHPNHKQRQG
ncbi:MAG: hypothetical protein EOM76_08100 [Sphingobacteriia bacterium]|nr:hypothetical protein [Sphingobacteriia bacterium]